MALDGAFLKKKKKELEENLINSKVDKIYQPSKDEIILFMRSREGVKKLLISARANSPRINITSSSPENPKVPPMLCMLLRKRLSGARLREIRQPELERLLFLDQLLVQAEEIVAQLQTCSECIGRHPLLA